MSKLPSESAEHPWESGAWPYFPPIDSDINCDVLIVGAGISGLTTAYLLAKEGRGVVIVEASHPAAGESGNTSAHLASALDDRFYRLEKQFGRDASFLIAESHRTAITAIESIIEQERITCAFERVPGYLFAADTEHEDAIQKEFEAAKRAGFKGLEMAEQGPIGSSGRCLRFIRQAQFHPTDYLLGLSQAILKVGGKILVNCEVTEVKDGHPVELQTRQGFVLKANEVLVATNTPVNNRFSIHTKQAAYRSYVMTFAIPNGAVPKALFWDNADPYHYVRTHVLNKQDALLMVGGEDHKVGQEDDPEACFTRLEGWTRSYFPQAGGVVKRWSGQVMEPIDGLAFIGRNPGDRHVFIATGDSGNGLTHGTIAGMLVSDLIQGRANPWTRIYDPSRKGTDYSSMAEFFKENINSALQYSDYFSPGDVKELTDIAPGEGAILRHGLRKHAVYRDEKGDFHEMSAVCPHLGGLVRWNRAEKTWDCPCHGSRFACDGNVLNGPAHADLERISNERER